jgi:hypothetical protein
MDEPPPPSSTTEEKLLLPHTPFPSISTKSLKHASNPPSDVTAGSGPPPAYLIMDLQIATIETQPYLTLTVQQVI